MNRFQALPLVLIAGIFIFSARARSPRNDSFQPNPAHRVATLKVKAKGLVPNSTFKVFLAADLLGEIATNADGRGSMHAEATVDGNSLRNRAPAILRFASPMADDLCFAPVYGEAEAAVLIRRNLHHRPAASATTTLITDARSMNGDASVFHTINWRSIKCVSTF
jgi:hypothetical protein